MMIAPPVIARQAGRMRYAPAQRLLRLAVSLAGARMGLTLADPRPFLT